MIHKVKLDGNKPNTAVFDTVKVKLSKQQLKKLKSDLGITNDVSNETLLQAYLNQKLV
jgi:hypothetical protein